MGTSKLETIQYLTVEKRIKKNREVKSTILLTVLVLNYVLIIINACEFQSQFYRMEGDVFL
jgi:hypothetical protein